MRARGRAGSGINERRAGGLRIREKEGAWGNKGGSEVLIEGGGERGKEGEAEGARE